MKTRIIKDLETCKNLWNRFSKNKTIWDEWDVVFSFYYENIHEPYFILLEEDSGLLPLWYDKEMKKYYFFGGNYPENRDIWMSPSDFSIIFDLIPSPAALFDISGKTAKKITEKNPKLKEYFKESDYRYFLKLDKFKNKMENYLSTFSPKHRKNFLYDIRKADNYSLKKEWTNEVDYDALIRFNVERFKEESDFYDETFIKEFKGFVKVMKEKNSLEVFTLKDKGKTVGTEIAVRNKDKYYVLNGGYDTSYANLGKLLIYRHIENAIEKNHSEIDFLVGDTGWKRLWKFDFEEVFTMRKG
ncbi:MAG: GNAT family N-acetyltransferase [Candidatus Woesearchaeota archaeon]